MKHKYLQISSPSSNVCLIQLNRPEKRNALSIEMMQELTRELRKLSNSNFHALVITGMGISFCAGLDLSEAKNPELKLLAIQHIQELFLLLRNMQIVTVAAIEGAAMAGGGGLAVCCDFLFAANNSSMGFPEVHIGIVPALVAALLKNRVLDRDLKELLLVGEPIEAKRLYEMGLLYRVVDEGHCIQRAIEFASLLGSQVNLATLKRTKALLNSFDSLSLQQNFENAVKAHF